MSIGASTPKQKATQAEKAAAEVAVKQNQDFRARYLPMEDQFMSRSQVTPQSLATAQAAANAAAAQAFGGKLLPSMLDPAGGTADSGRAITGGLETATAFGDASGRGVAAARAGVEENASDANTKIVKFGRGIADNTQSNFLTGARTAFQAARAKAQLADERRVTALTTAGQGLGMAAAFQPVRMALATSLNRATGWGARQGVNDKGY